MSCSYSLAFIRNYKFVSVRNISSHITMYNTIYFTYRKKRCVWYDTCASSVTRIEILIRRSSRIERLLGALLWWVRLRVCASTRVRDKAFVSLTKKILRCGPTFTRLKQSLGCRNWNYPSLFINPICRYSYISRQDGTIILELFHKKPLQALKENLPQAERLPNCKKLLHFTSILNSNVLHLWRFLPLFTFFSVIELLKQFFEISTSV